MCVLSAELVKACKDSVGGIKKVWAVQLAAKATLTKAAGAVVTLTITVPAVFLGWAFDIEMAQMGASPTRSDENGTVFFQQTLAVKLHKWDLAKSQEIEKISKSDILVIALDNNGVYWLFGEENGLRWSEGAADSGKAFGDFSGFDMGFVGKEKSMPLTVPSGVITTLGLT